MYCLVIAMVCREGEIYETYGIQLVCRKVTQEVGRRQEVIVQSGTCYTAISTFPVALLSLLPFSLSIFTTNDISFTFTRSKVSEEVPIWFLGWILGITHLWKKNKFTPVKLKFSVDCIQFPATMISDLWTNLVRLNKGMTFVVYFEFEKFQNWY